MTKSWLSPLAVALCASTFVAAAADREVTLPAGTALRVRLDSSVASDASRSEDPVSARLVNALVVSGRTVVPAGSVVNGIVTQAQPSGKVKGRASVGLRFDSLTSGGERYRIETRQWMRLAPTTKKRDAATIAIPATGGAIVGGILGGKKGAAIGATAGGGAGTVAVLSTPGKEVRLGRGATILVRLSKPLTVRVR